MVTNVNQTSDGDRTIVSTDVEHNGVHWKLTENAYFTLYHKLLFYDIPCPNQSLVLANLGVFFLFFSLLEITVEGTSLYINSG